MRVAIVTFPGSNCDYDLYKCVQLVGGSPEFRWHREVELGEVDAVMLPGGFSYGDYLRAGAIATMSPIMDAVKEFAASGGPVLGICNGFQTLCESGLLPGALLRNRSLLFASQDVLLRVENTDPRSLRRSTKSARSSACRSPMPRGIIMPMTKRSTDSKGRVGSSFGMWTLKGTPSTVRTPTARPAPSPES